jgi:hypothetical protein
MECTSSRTDRAPGVAPLPSLGYTGPAKMNKLTLTIMAATAVVGAVVITFAVVNAWTTAETVLDYLEALGATAMYVWGAVSILAGLGYIVLKQLRPRRQQRQQ